MPLDEAAEPASLIKHVSNAISDLAMNQFPAVPNPPNCTKRASVALIIRARPNFLHWPPSTSPATNTDPSQSIQEQLAHFFSQPWSQQGDPEILFIKRAARSGDRWTSHVALPGGKRDAEDADDKATSIRETLEEVGIDLNDERAIFVGNLPQRVITTDWGNVPLMVLCPFVFLLTHHAVPSLKLQPAEVGSAHWVSIRALLSPSLLTFECADVSDRCARRGGLLVRYFLRLMLGKMRFAAVRLIPTESLYCSSAPGFLPPSSSSSPNLKLNPDTTTKPPQSALLATLTHYLRTLTLNLTNFTTPPKRPSTDKPLLLWGLTLDIVADFLELLIPHNESNLWSYPTYTPLDIRFVTWLVTYSFRRRKRLEIERGAGMEGGGPARVEVGLDAVASGGRGGEAVGEGRERAVKWEGAGQGDQQKAKGRQQGLRSSAVRVMLDGYFEILQKAVILAVVLRLGVGAAVGLALWRRLVRARRRK